MRQSWETMTAVSAGDIILTPTQLVGGGRPPPHQESRALPTELPRPPSVLVQALDYCHLSIEEERPNTYHRKQLKKNILDIRYPNKITNRFPESAQEKPLSIQTPSVRWRLFGHILRRDKDIHAIKATIVYFIPNGNKLRGRQHCQ